MGQREFDAIVIGAGAPGEVCAGRLADGGLDVAIVEPHLVGGECSYYACMPSKALLRPAETLAEIRRVPGAAEAVTGPLDVEAALKRRDEVIHDLDDSSQLPWLEERGIELFRAPGALDGERRVKAGDDVLVARKAVVVATGSDPSIPPIDGLRESKPWDNREATTSKTVPDSLIVLGGGPVGTEMAQAWHSFGADVALVEGDERLLPREEPFAGEQVADALREDGVDLHIGTKASAVRAQDDAVTVEFDDGESLSAEVLLVAIGRTARTAGIGLESVGVEVGRWLEVDDQLLVDGTDWLYGVGDVTGRALFTHMGKYQGRIAADHILGKKVAATAERRALPRVTFTDPQVAAVGPTLAAVQEAGINARAVDVQTSATAGASFIGRDTPGTTRIVIDEDRRVIVGATFVGTETADFLHAATVAVVGEVPLDELWHAVPAYPTRSEIWLKWMEAYGL